MDRRDFVKSLAIGAAGMAGLAATLPLSSGCGRDSSSHLPVGAPEGFTWLDNPVSGKLFVDSQNIFTTTFDPTGRRHTGGATYFVDVVNGSDTNLGSSASTALQSVAAACAMADVGTVMVKGYGSAEPYYRGVGFNNAVQSRSLNVIGYGDDIPYITTHDVLTFAPARTGSGNTFQATRTNVTQCIDMVGGAPGATLTQVSDPLKCDDLPGSWCQNGSTLYVHPADGRDLSLRGASALWALLSVPNFKNVGDNSSYLENVVLYGGTDCVNASGGTPAGGLLTLVRVETGVSQPFGGNNVSAWGVDSVLISCQTTRSGQDGFNYHALNGKKPRIVEIDCRAADCGHGASDQCSSAHDGAKIIRVGGTYRDARAANVADINGTADGTESWNLGCLAEGAGSGFANWQCGISEDTGPAPKMWLHACDTANADYSTATFGTGQIFVRDSRLAHNLSTVLEY